MTSRISAEATNAVDAGNYLGETPVWSEHEQALYWINVEKESELHRWSPASGERRQWAMPERTGGLVLKRGGGALMVLSHGLYDLDFETGALSKRLASPLPAHVSLHECVTDRQGRLWVGAFDHRFRPDAREVYDASYFRLDGDTLVPVIEGITIANGLAFNPDGSKIYVGDSNTRVVHTYDVDAASGAVSNKREFLRLPLGIGHLDGATVDAQGGYWLSLMNGGALHRYRPDGSLDLVLELPFSGPTKAVFGGAALDTLYITTTRMVAGATQPAGFDLNGPVYSCRPGFKGLSDTPLAQ